MAKTPQRSGQAAAHAASREATSEAVLPPPAARSYRVLVADDHAIVRHGLRLLLGIEVCWEAANGLEVIDVVKREKPDMIVLDLTMPEMNGLEAVREVLRCGALAYVLKSDADTDLLAAVDHVRQNQPFFTTGLTLSMAQSYVRRPGDPVGSDAVGLPLTARETEVVQLLAEGKSNKEVAAALGVSTRTIESHRNHIMHRMGFASFSDLVRFAVRNSLIEP